MYTVVKVDGATPKRWRFVRSHDKPIHGSCAIYFPGGMHVYVYIYIYLYIYIYTHYTLFLFVLLSDIILLPTFFSIKKYVPFSGDVPVWNGIFFQGVQRMGCPDS